MMTRLRSNFIANVMGIGWAAVMQLAFTPYFLRTLGAEAYGLIGFFLVLQATLQVLDLGITPTISRGLARYSVDPAQRGEARDFVRTFELVYWLLGISIGAGLFACTGVITHRWLNVATLHSVVVNRAVARMAVICAMQWPVTFYQAALRGLERQVPLNVVKLAAATAAYGGGALVLLDRQSDVVSFFDVQVIVYTVHAVILAVVFWYYMPSMPERPRFAPALVRNVWRFAAGMTGITVAGVIVSQLDKIVVSRLLPLSTFGFYTLGSVVASGLIVIITPTFNTLFPRFAALVAHGDEATLRTLYHDATQVLGALILPPAALVVFFSKEILQAWTGNAGAANAASIVASLLVIGTAINGLLNLPYALQLAYGWTSLAFVLAAASIGVAIPLLLIFGKTWGLAGIAAVWPLVNLLNFIFMVVLTHRRLLRGAALRWVFRDIGPVLLVSVSVVALARLVAPVDLSRLASVILLAVVLGAAMAAAALFTRSARGFLLTLLRSAET